MEANNIAIGKLSPMNRVDRWIGIKGQETIKIRGVALIDLLDAYKKMSYYELETYRLDFVAEKELGVGKDDISVLPGKLWEQGDYSKLLHYNRVDVELLVELDKKLGIIKYLDAVSTIASCDISDCLHNSQIVDSYILRRAVKEGIVLPSRDFTRKRSNYKGAFVFDSIRGVHDKVAVYDFNSLYPSILISFDISPETIRTGDSESSYTVVRGDEPAFIPRIIENILNLRKEYRNKGEDNNQRTMKEIANSFYGVMALPSFRLYTPQMAAMITEKGREVIQRMIEVVENE
jgi:DNA polymerase elongation subunit (family B)